MPTVIFVCDGCGVKQEGSFGHHGSAHKPEHWYVRSDDDGTQVACSRRCIDYIAEKTAKTSVILPI